MTPPSRTTPRNGLPQCLTIDDPLEKTLASHVERIYTSFDPVLHTVFLNMASKLAPFLVKGKTAIVTGAGSGMQFISFQYILLVLTIK